MLVEITHAHLPELGQVWGNSGAFETFKRTVQEQNPEHWETLRAWFQAATRDRGFLLEIPERDELKAVLAGEVQHFSLTIVFGNPEAVEVQMRMGFESYLRGGLLIAMGETLELFTHTYTHTR